MLSVRSPPFTVFPGLGVLPGRGNYFTIRSNCFFSKEPYILASYAKFCVVFSINQYLLI